MTRFVVVLAGCPKTGPIQTVATVDAWQEQVVRIDDVDDDDDNDDEEATEEN